MFLFRIKQITYVIYSVKQQKAIILYFIHFRLKVLPQKMHKNSPAMFSYLCRFAARALVLKAPPPRLTIKHAEKRLCYPQLRSTRENLFFVIKSLILSSLLEKME